MNKVSLVAALLVTTLSSVAIASPSYVEQAYLNEAHAELEAYGFSTTDCTVKCILAPNSASGVCNAVFTAIEGTTTSESLSCFLSYTGVLCDLRVHYPQLDGSSKRYSSY